MSLLQKLAIVFGISILPLIELRGAIPVGAGMNIPWFWCFLASILGNFLPIPFILLFIRKIFQWMKRSERLKKIVLWLEKKAYGKSEKVLKFASAGLFLFVAVPLPGTGAWTGALIAALLDMRMRYALPSIFAGILVADFLVAGISYGFLGILSGVFL